MPFFFLCLMNLGLALAVTAAFGADSGAADVAVKPTAIPLPKVLDVKSVSVTRAVGEVGPRIVTSREVRMNEAISQIVNPPAVDVAGTKKRIIAIDDPAFPAQVLKVLDEWTVFLEANVIGSKTADKAEAARLAKLVLDAWKGFPDWERLEASPNEIRDIIERKLAAQSLEHLKGDASLVNVSDAEALQYFKKNRLRFGNLPFENFKDGIKQALIRSQTERRLTEWRAVLRKKYRVRNFVGA
jgi:hypothetical protein